MIFKRKRKPGIPKNRPPSVSVNRYYGSSLRGKKARLKEPQPAGSNSTIIKKIRNITKFITHSLPVILIAVLLVLNITVSGVAVKIQGEDGYEFRPHADYKASIQELINRSVFNKNKLTLNSTQLETDIMEYFSEVSSATVVVPLAGRVLNVGLKLDAPLLRVSNLSAKQGVVGESGRLIFLEKSDVVLSSFSSLPSMSIEPEVNFLTGDLVLTSQENELITLLIQEFDGQLDMSRPKLSSLVFQLNKREISAFFEGKSYFVKLTPEREAREQVGSLIATFEHLAKQGSEPQEYIDVRVEERVFVK